MTVIDLTTFYEEAPEQKSVDAYVRKALDLAGNWNEVALSGNAPVWLYMAIANALQAKAKKLIYRSSAMGDMVVFDRNAC